ncbi:tetratricopeptide (TPR) repeat protein [Caulobacter ginsengisoli]|uniref:Tetratricopeptide (TPR) repeat protein n=1 Tax=Caulobacter ginsengisoli TaxID=400775 RepID=A0ABU0IS37_9CAUL|nr:tetratricopeptide repeat protein [Caulobacter ginsengisoli]MDQ0464823.1 tetratricopeptide (TPR) repeat protein [Caulobacter ginsengisoli]
MFRSIWAGGVALVLLAACKPAPPEPMPADLNTGEQCFKDGHYGCAAQNFYGYLKLYPNDTHAMAMEAFSLTKQGAHKDAIYWYNKAAQAGVGTYDFYAFYAESLEATGDLDGAIKYNRRSLDLVPTLVDVRGSLAGELVKQGKPQEALDLLESFDRGLIKQGHPPYFTGQILAIKDQMKAAK